MIPGRCEARRPVPADRGRQIRAPAFHIGFGIAWSYLQCLRAMCASQARPRGGAGRSSRGGRCRVRDDAPDAKPNAAVMLVLVSIGAVESQLRLAVVASARTPSRVTSNAVRTRASPTV